MSREGPPQRAWGGAPSPAKSRMARLGVTRVSCTKRRFSSVGGGADSQGMRTGLGLPLGPPVSARTALRASRCPPPPRPGSFPSRSQPQCVSVVCPTEDRAQCSPGRDKAISDVRGNPRWERNRPRASPKGWAPRRGRAHNARGSACTKPPPSRGPPDQELATLVLEKQRASHVPRPPDAPFMIRLIAKSCTQPRATWAGGRWGPP